MTRALGTLLSALALACVAPISAVASPLLSDGDAAELAQSLAEATEEQGVCYGWNVLVSDQSGGQGGIDSGSSGGPDAPVGAAVSLDCTKTVVLEGSVSYTCESCESEDSSSATVRSSFPGGPTTADLEQLGLDGGQLKNEDGDVVLANMVGALPIIAASKGAAGPLEAAALTGPTGAAATDRATGTPSTPDWLRESWLALAVCLLAIIAGVWWFLAVVVKDRRDVGRAAQRAVQRDARKRRQASAEPAPAPASPSDPPAPEDR